MLILEGHMQDAGVSAKITGQFKLLFVKWLS